MTLSHSAFSLRYSVIRLLDVCSHFLFFADILEQNNIVLLEGAFEDHQAQLLETFRATQKIKHATEGIFQMPPGH